MDATKTFMGVIPYFDSQNNDVIRPIATLFVSIMIVGSIINLYENINKPNAIKDYLQKIKLKNSNAPQKKANEPALENQRLRF